MPSILAIVAKALCGTCLKLPGIRMRGGRACCVRAGYHAVLTVKDAYGDSGAACGGLRSLTAALPREAPCAGNPAPFNASRNSDEHPQHSVSFVFVVL